MKYEVERAGCDAEVFDEAGLWDAFIGSADEVTDKVGEAIDQYAVVLADRLLVHQRRVWCRGAILIDSVRLADALGRVMRWKAGV